MWYRWLNMWLKRWLKFEVWRFFPFIRMRTSTLWVLPVNLNWGYLRLIGSTEFYCVAICVKILAPSYRTAVFVWLWWSVVLLLHPVAVGQYLFTGPLGAQSWFWVWTGAVICHMTCCVRIVKYYGHLSINSAIVLSTESTPLSLALWNHVWCPHFYFRNHQHWNKQNLRSRAKIGDSQSWWDWFTSQQLLSSELHDQIINIYKIWKACGGARRAVGGSPQSFKYIDNPFKQVVF